MTQPNKALGQHWLTDEFILQDICSFAEVNEGDFVLEIGPGLGALTQVLLQHGATVHAVEFDKALASQLPQAITQPGLTVEQADILHFDLSKLPAGYKVVANVPYYITSGIVRKLLESDHPPHSATLLVQKEVAQRIAAGPGEMSLLSVSAQFYADVELGPEVDAKFFTPPPKVDSQVVKLTYTGPQFDDVDPNDFFRVVKAGFGERRKKLRSSLAGGLHLPKEQIDELLNQAGITADARAQELTIEQWHQLTRLIDS